MTYLDQQNWPAEVGPMDAWKEKFGDVEPLEEDETVPSGLSKQECRHWLREHGVSSKELAREAGRCAEPMEYGRYCARLPRSSLCWGSGDKCHIHDERA